MPFKELIGIEIISAPDQNFSVVLEQWILEDFWGPFYDDVIDRDDFTNFFEKFEKNFNKFKNFFLNSKNLF